MTKQHNANFLPPKELSIFKRIVKYYDQKQYKNGLKYAKQILGNPKFAENGETLAMKGILLNCLGKKNEAREYVKRGLQANITSFVCWHIYGLIQKSDQKYEEAIKCYLQALRLEPDNLQVLRDLSVLQMQLRNYEGCKDTRYKLLMLRPSQRASWIGYALVHHLLGNYETTLTVINEFLKGQTEPSHGYELGELVLYKTMVMVENNDHEHALAYLKEQADEVVDTCSFLELKVELLISLKNFEEAEKDVWTLLNRNSENRNYIELLYKAHGVIDYHSAESVLLRRNLLNEVLARHPHSKLSKRMMLEVCFGDEFMQKLDEYLIFYIRKGAPPLFVQLKILWTDPEKIRCLETLLDKYRQNMTNFQSLQSDPIVIEPPSTTVWLAYFMAQFLAYKRQYSDALAVIDSHLSYTPTLVDFYVLKADVYAMAGDLITASRWMEEAQSLDTADRYINARCTKYLVQANRIGDAVNMASKFTRGNQSAADYLSEMQCMWFLIENARTLRDQGKYGESLKYCHEIEQHYRDILDDQLDFHSYCLRRGTLRAYVQTLRLEDRLREHPSYFDIAKLAIEIYLHLNAHPLGKADDQTVGNEDTVSTSEAKKLRNKQRKAARRAEAEAVRSRAEQERRDQAARSRQPANEETETERPVTAINGLKPHDLARPQSPLDEACKFLRPLLNLQPNRIEVQCLAYEVYEFKGKWLLMLQAIKKGQQITGSQDHPWFHECCVRFMVKLIVYMPRLRATPDSPVHKILANTEPFQLVEGATSIPGAFNENFEQRNSASYPHRFRAMLLKCLIDEANSPKYLSQLPLPNKALNDCTWQACAECLALLKNARFLPSQSLDPVVVERYREQFHDTFPLTNAFLSSSERSELCSKMVENATETSVCGVYTEFNGNGVIDGQDGLCSITDLARSLCAFNLCGQQHDQLVNGGGIGDCSVENQSVNIVQLKEQAKFQTFSADPSLNVL